MTMALEIRVRGRVQGVGFRPTVWRMASELGLRGEVFNDGEGVIVRAGGTRTDLEALIARLQREPPPLGRIDTIETREFFGALPASFRIAESQGGPACTEITPDAAICTACAAEVFDRFERRFRYPFTNCPHRDGAIFNVQRLRRRIPQSRGPAVPRRGDRLPCLRPQGKTGPAGRAGRVF